MTRSIRLALAALLLTPIALQAQQVSPNPTLEQLIAALDADDLQTRETATRTLANSPDVSLASMEAAIARNTLTGEQRHRLLNAAHQKFATTPRAAMGVRFAQDIAVLASRERVIIAQTYSPFNSTQVLEPGDIITAADGFTLDGVRGAILLRALIQSHDPEDRMPITIRRGPETIHTEIILGKFSDLPSAAISEDDLPRAWQMRTWRMSNLANNVIACPVPEEAGIDPDQSVKSRTVARWRAESSGSRPTRVAAGGAYRSGPIDEAELLQWSLERGSRDPAINVTAARNLFESDVWAQALPRLIPIREEIADLRGAALNLESLIRRGPDETVQPGIGNTPGKGQLEDWTRQLNLIKKVLAAVEAEAAEQGIDTSAIKATESANTIVR